MIKRRTFIEPFHYTIKVQWCDKRRKYEAFSPSLVKFASDFKLENSAISYADSIANAASKAVKQTKNVLEELKNMGILPPDPDVVLDYPDFFEDRKRNKGDIV